MNTVNNLYDKIISKENLKVALTKASRGKRKERKVINALANWQEVIDDLHNQLKNETWRPNDIHRIKIINDGVQAKKREIVCPDFLNEHVIYHAVMNVCKPYFINRFYKHSYASIPKYGGVRNAIKYIRHAMKVYWVCNFIIFEVFSNNTTFYKTTRIFENCCYFLKGGY